MRLGLSGGGGGGSRPGGGDVHKRCKLFGLAGAKDCLMRNDGPDECPSHAWSLGSTMSSVVTLLAGGSPD